MKNSLEASRFLNRQANDYMEMMADLGLVSKPLLLDCHALDASMFKKIIDAVNLCNESDLDSDVIHVLYYMVSNTVNKDYFMPVTDGKNEQHIKLYPEAIVALGRLNSMFCSRVLLSGF